MPSTFIIIIASVFGWISAVAAFSMIHDVTLLVVLSVFAISTVVCGAFLFALSFIGSTKLKGLELYNFIGSFKSIWLNNDWFRLFSKLVSLCVLVTAIMLLMRSSFFVETVGVSAAFMFGSFMALVTLSLVVGLDVLMEVYERKDQKTFINSFSPKWAPKNPFCSNDVGQFPNFVESEEDQINSVKWQQHHAKVEGGARVFCVGNISSKSRISRLACFIADFEKLSVDQCDDFSAVMDSVKANPDGWLAVIIDIDDIEREYDIFDIVSDLFEFRNEYLSPAIILISRNFAQSDYGASRAAIADICCVASTPDRVIVDAIPEAVVNNKSWRKRQGEIFHKIKNLEASHD